jgi:effector-binding domain-containing protein
MIRFMLILLGSLFCLASWAWAGQDYQIRLREVASQTAVCLGTKTTMDKIGQETGSLYGRIFQYLGSRKINPAGPALVVYPSPPGEEIELEACVPVSEGIIGEGRIEAKELAGGEMASVTHLGSYEGLGRAYEALMKWMAEEGYSPCGPPREVYELGPPHANPSDYKTEILWPVRKK